MTFIWGRTDCDEGWVRWEEGTAPGPKDGYATGLEKVDVLPLLYGGEDGLKEANAIAKSIERLDFTQAKCAYEQDRQMMLACIETSFGDVEILNTVCDLPRSLQISPDLPRSPPSVAIIASSDCARCNTPRRFVPTSHSQMMRTILEAKSKEPIQAARCESFAELQIIRHITDKQQQDTARSQRLMKNLVDIQREHTQLSRFKEWAQTRLADEITAELLANAQIAVATQSGAGASTKAPSGLSRLAPSGKAMGRGTGRGAGRVVDRDRELAIRLQQDEEAALAARSKNKSSANVAPSTTTANLGHMRSPFVSGDQSSLASELAEKPLQELLFIEATLTDLAPAVRRAARAKEERQRTEHGEELLCAVCMTRPKDVVQNCGHRFCSECSTTQTLCPICRVHITQRIVFY